MLPANDGPSQPTPYWLLIAVLHSSIPLTPPLAMRLYRAAVELERERRAVEKLTGDLALGELRRLGREMLLGSMSGPGFEAVLDTPHGHAEVRFILTRQGLAEMGLGGDEEDDAPSPRRPLN